MTWSLDTIVAAAVPFFFIGIFLELFFSIKNKSGLYRTNDTITNLSLGIIQQITGLYTKTLPVFLFAIMQKHLQFFQLPFFDHSLASLLSWVFAFLSIDFVYYWFHRKAHEINLLWASHVAHHSSEEFNLSVALRQSSIQMFFSSFFYAPLAVLGITWEVFGVCFAINLIYQFWVHTEVVRSLGALENIFNTPSHHRVHHGKNPKYIDRNHAGVFIIWDKWFGTFQQEEEKPIYGITVPLRTFNPIQANLHHFFALVGDLLKSKNWNDRFHLLFNKPGWRPVELGGPIPIKEIDRSQYVKFDPPLTRNKTLFLSAVFALLTGVGVYIQNFHFKLNPYFLGVLIIFELALLAWVGAKLTSWNLKNSQQNKSEH